MLLRLRQSRVLLCLRQSRPLLRLKQQLRQPQRRPHLFSRH